ncbi:MAG: aminoglycoside phosphotransferase family protein [Methylovulum sp.]|nr:aminoglycoside phosphotransferase family protein [Methylovulum sp.]MDD2722402.1 aminoglycoside phosphotransferase family protein [Methylovulum sp.]MDD5125775.1 aminoglycoside phosphotransferase family protein [Methylovulum sp.]
MSIEKNLLHSIAGHFAKSINSITPLGNGLINDTFLVTSTESRQTESRQFVLQRINRQVFPEPELITANLLTLNQHIRQQTDVHLQMPAILCTATGLANFQDELGNSWRAQSFIAGTKSLESLRSLDDAAQTGYALGHFHRLTSSLKPNKLHDTLPGFHITPDYLRNYHAVAQQTQRFDPFCADFIREFEHPDILESAKQQKHLQVRVIHGDPKLNNFLFAQDGKIISLIDLDTVKPGLVHYDIGDCLRSCCHDAATNTFNLDKGAAILKSYLDEAAAFFSGEDYDYLFPAIQLLPFELGLRFYTDYLQGDRYFKITGPGQNLQRAKAQFQLCASVMAQKAEIEALIRRVK